MFNKHHYLTDMKPTTRLQKEIARYSKGMSGLTQKQKAYAFQHCFRHYAHKTKGGVITCMECGYSWKSEHQLAETICGCTCPHCGQELEVLDTRKRVIKDNEYFSVITTCKGYQVIRFFFASVRRKVKCQAVYCIDEVVQRWIAPNGKSETVARLRSMSSYYYDLWNFNSDMEIRQNKGQMAYDIQPVCTYPVIRTIPELRRNGFNGNFHRMRPYALFVAILSDVRKETLLKCGQINMLHHFCNTYADMQEYWPAIKICIRNKYMVKDASMWCDYIRLLKGFGKDIRNAHYVCPNDLQGAHDKWMRLRQIQMEREQAAQARRKAMENERKFKELKGKFFGISFTDGQITVRVLESIEEYMEEGKAMHHCVFSNEYYLKKNSLILSATIDGIRIETVEVSLESLKVIQSRGVCNENTEYHDSIVALVNKNAPLFQKRLGA